MNRSLPRTLSFVLLSGAAVAAGVSWLFGRGDTPSSEPADLTVATYNLNFGLAGDEATLDTLEALEAGVLVLQETSPEWELHIRARLGARYPHQHWLHSESYPAGGSAILSRHPLREIRESPSAVGWFAAIRAVVETPSGPVQVIDVHLKPPVSASGSLVVGYFTTPDERRLEMEQHLDALHDRDLPTIVAGDFNESRGEALSLLGQLGFENAGTRFAPGRPTWRWQLGPVRLRHRLDHVLHDARLECLGAVIVDAGRSDHVPVVARFRMRSG